MRVFRLLPAISLTLSCVAANDARVVPQRPAVADEPLAAEETPEPEAPAAPLSPWTVPPGAYDLGQLPVLSKVLFYARENYFDKSRFNFKNMALGALDFVQRDIPEVLIDRPAGRDGSEVGVTVDGQRRVFSLARVDAAWSLRSTLQEIFRFVQRNLPPVSPEAEGRRVLEVETAAVNGMLYTLDPHSVLLAAETYSDMRPRRADERGRRRPHAGAGRQETDRGDRRGGGIASLGSRHHLRRPDRAPRW
jgi:carboxyl-terminal processing protease